MRNTIAKGLRRLAKEHTVGKPERDTDKLYKAYKKEYLRVKRKTNKHEL